MNYMYIIETLRERYGMKQTDMADLLGIKKASYTNYKRYDRIMPIEHLNTIANYFNVSLDFIFGFTTIKKYDFMDKL